MMAPEEPGTVAEIAAGSDDFDTLEAALAAAGLTATLDGPGPFTVFAPTDDAFAALPGGTIDDSLLPENQVQLIDILTYHVVGEELGPNGVVHVIDAVLTPPE